jgi:hypothetical protein
MRGIGGFSAEDPGEAQCHDPKGLDKKPESIKRPWPSWSRLLFAFFLQIVAADFS